MAASILHISQYCHAGSIGGTERYLLDLIRGLQSNGMECQIGWLCSDRSDPFEAQGILVHPLPAPPMRVDEPPPQLTTAAESLLKSFQPDVVHFHTFGLAETTIARIAGQRGIPYAFTYHSPGWTCRRGDLLIWGGEQPCDGEVRTLRCAACKVQERFGGPAFGGYLGAVLSAPLDWMFSQSGRVNFRRRVCFLSDTRRYGRALREFLGGCSLLISCSQWGRPVLIVNGAKPARVKIIPQGVPSDFVASGNRVEGWERPRQPEKPFTIGYIGRVTPVKGVDILTEGFSRVQGDDVRLKIYGFVENEKTVAKLNRRLTALAQRDPRIQLNPKLALAQMVGAYEELDLLVIPSVGPETGPLVLFEGLQLGIPIFGSNRLGHPDLLREGGMIVDPNTPNGWQRVLVKAVDEFRKGEWGKRREHVRTELKIRSMENVAAGMAVSYQTVMAECITSPAKSQNEVTLLRCNGSEC